MHHYERLQKKLDQHPVGAPASEEFLEILKLLFLEDEVKIALCLDFQLKTVKDIAAQAEVSEEEAREKLEAMANRGSLLAKKVEGEYTYALLPNYPGLFEYPVMKGMDEAKQKRLAELWHAYYMKYMAAELAAARPPWLRVFPTEETFTEEVEILPYEKASEMMGKAESIALARCPCRIVEQNCEKPLQVCLSFDGAARFLIERDMAREIGLKEANDILHEADRAGLVHAGSNNMENLLFLCNCCSCCCHFMRLLTELGYDESLATSSYRVQSDDEKCSGCGICAEERCPISAIELVSEKSRINVKRCIGCGLCVTSCPSGALQMVKREDYQKPPATTKELAKEVMAYKNNKQK